VPLTSGNKQADKSSVAGDHDVMSSQIVETREELKKALADGAEEIVVKGELANKLKKAKTITKIGASGLGILTVASGASVIAAPVTGGISLFAAAPIAALTGTEVATIIIAISLGIALVMAVYKGYDEIEYSGGKLVLRKKVGTQNQN